MHQHTYTHTHTYMHTHALRFDHVFSAHPERITNLFFAYVFLLRYVSVCMCVRDCEWCVSMCACVCVMYERVIVWESVYVCARCVCMCVFAILSIIINNITNFCCARIMYAYVCMYVCVFVCVCLCVCVCVCMCLALSIRHLLYFIHITITLVTNMKTKSLAH